ncbi:MAG TPA: hypothetical protein VEC57_05265 [Candidatus Limnocylindrales bacterium]|nr:hypothetical protein [Candidatus Limnocylindrales bacterium]
MLPLAAAVAGCGPGGGGDDVLYDVSFRLSETPEPLSELRFTIAYHGGGSFVGTGTQVDCEAAGGAGDVDVDFDDDDVSELTVAMSADDALEEDATLVRCTFVAEQKPTSGNFPITINDAVAEDGGDVDNDDVTVIVDSVVESAE